MVLEFINSKRETALLAQKYIDDGIEFECKVEPFINKMISPKFIDGKTYKIAVYGFEGYHGRSKTRILSTANVIKSIELGCYLSDKIFSRIKFRDGNPLNYHLENIELRFLEYQKLPYKEGVVLGTHLGNPDAKNQDKRRARAIVVEQDGSSHETMYYRYVYESYLGDKLEDNVEIDHIDGNIRNNKISNLRTVSITENRLKSRLCGEGKFFNGIKMNRYKCPVCGITFDREAEFNSLKNKSTILCSKNCAKRFYASASDYNIGNLVSTYINYDYLTSMLISGPIEFGRIVSCVRSVNPNYIFPIISKISNLISDSKWHDVLYYTYCNQIKLSLNKNESPEVINCMIKFMLDYETVKTAEYIFNIMNNDFVYTKELLPNQFKFQSSKGVSPFDVDMKQKYAVIPKQIEIVPELHHFVI